MITKPCEFIWIDDSENYVVTIPAKYGGDVYRATKETIPINEQEKLTRFELIGYLIDDEKNTILE